MSLDDANQWTDVVYAVTLPTLSPIADDGLVTLGNIDVMLTLTGRPLFIRLVASAFDAYRQGQSMEEPKYAQAV